MAFKGVPVKGTPGYPGWTQVRRLFSREELASKEWQKELAERDATEAKGDEPLAYCYCSSQNAPPEVPKFYIFVESESHDRRRIPDLR